MKLFPSLIRKWLTASGIIALVLMLSACGFALRGAVVFPFNSIFIDMPLNSPLGGELKRNIRSSGQTTIALDAKSADVALQVLAETREKAILSYNSQGRAREYNLIYNFRFRVVDKAGREVLVPTGISLKRTISFNESQVLAKESEEGLLYRDMQSDLVQQIMRRLTVLKME
jgi:LPS-assembly lipoprotein